MDKIWNGLLFCGAIAWILLSIFLVVIAALGLVHYQSEVLYQRELKHKEKEKLKNGNSQNIS